MSRQIIGIGGETRVGKDTFASLLIDRGYHHGSFAKNLKEMCRQVFNLTPFLTDTQEGKEKKLEMPRRLALQQLQHIIRWMGKTHTFDREATREVDLIKREYIDKPTLQTGKPKEFTTAREILQFVGTEICRRIHKDYHVDVLMHTVRHTPGNWVITDVRFANERDMLKGQFGATLVRIKRPDYTPAHLMGDTSPEGSEAVIRHASEASLGLDFEYDLVVINDGTIDELKEQARSFL